jgi:uncharacterized protein YjbJ (UPF0337 family)
MDKNRIVGAAHQVKGAVKETVGKVTGNAKTQAEGSPTLFSALSWG